LICLEAFISIVDKQGKTGLKSRLSDIGETDKPLKILTLYVMLKEINSAMQASSEAAAV
jgi:hypothetical protein